MLLAIGIAVGWKLRQWQGGKAAVRSSRHEVLQIAFPGATARRGRQGRGGGGARAGGA